MNGREEQTQGILSEIFHSFSFCLFIYLFSFMVLQLMYEITWLQNYNSVMIV